MVRRRASRADCWDGLQKIPVGGYGRSPHAPVGPSASAPASGHRAIMASAVGLPVAPEQLPQLSERCLDEGQVMLALDIADIPNPQDAVQLLRGHLQRPWRKRCPGRWLWVGG